MIKSRGEKREVFKDSLTVETVEKREKIKSDETVYYEKVVLKNVDGVEVTIKQASLPDTLKQQGKVLTITVKDMQSTLEEHS